MKTHIPYRRILQCNGSWTPYSDGLLPNMMFDENSHFSLQCKLEIYSNWPSGQYQNMGVSFGPGKHKNANYFKQICSGSARLYCCSTNTNFVMNT